MAVNSNNEIYKYGAKALGREFDFIERDENTTKEEFTSFIKSKIAQGFPVIALGIIGPPEPCIVAGYDASGDILVGWNFFQEDTQFSSKIRLMDNGYFCSDSWWENTDTQAVMCIGEVSSVPCSDKDILKIAGDIMEAREEGFYAKGIRAYDAWKEMLLDEKWFETSAGFDDLFSKFLVQNDAITCLCDGRKWGAKYFKELSEKYGKAEKDICLEIAKHFGKISNIAEEMGTLVGDWSDTEKMLGNFGSRAVREKLGNLIDAAKSEDILALKQIKVLLKFLRYRSCG